MKTGDKVKIKNIKDYPEYNGKEGLVTAIRDDGSGLGTWGDIAVRPENDEIEVFTTGYNLAEEPCIYKQYLFEFETPEDANAVFEEELDEAVDMFVSENKLSVVLEEKNLLHFAKNVNEIIAK